MVHRCTSEYTSWPSCASKCCHCAVHTHDLELSTGICCSCLPLAPSACRCKNHSRTCRQLPACSHTCDAGSLLPPLSAERLRAVACRSSEPFPSFLDLDYCCQATKDCYRDQTAGGRAGPLTSQKGCDASCTANTTGRDFTNFLCTRWDGEQAEQVCK